MKNIYISWLTIIISYMKGVIKIMNNKDKISFSSYLLECEDYRVARDNLNNLIKEMHLDDVFVGNTSQKALYKELTDKHNKIVINHLEEYCKKYC